jgi:hypothetical protein
MPFVEPEPVVEDAVVPSPAFEEEKEPPQNALTQEQLDAMFAEPEPMESLVDEETDESAPVDEPEDLPEPEPIPPVFTDPASIPEDEDERSGSALLVALVALLVVAGIVGGLYLAREGVMAMVPASRAVYDLVGLGGERLGAGLEIRNVLSERETENNTDVLVVRGTIPNVDQKQRPIPLIRVVLYDAGSNALQDMVMPPLKPELDAGEDIGFRARVVDPSPLARRVEVTFAEAPPQPES